MGGLLAEAFDRVYEQTVDGVRRGFHKPIMSAGGLGTISADMTEKIVFPAGTLLVQIGGPGMRIGMGGGAASSMAAGANAAELDFDSVQRGNPEIERRAQEVINHCWGLGDDNPVLAIHDVGAGGLSNAFPELAITTNGVLVDRFIDVFERYGVRNVNVSLDTLRPERMQRITRRDHYKEVIGNIRLLMDRGFDVKVNTVLIRGTNDDEIGDFVQWTADEGVRVRFIEFMPRWKPC